MAPRSRFLQMAAAALIAASSMAIAYAEEASEEPEFESVLKNLRKADPPPEATPKEEKPESAKKAPPEPRRADIVRCAAEKNDLQRLECFDNLAKSIKATTETKAEVEGGWIVRSATSPVNDKTNVSLIVLSNEIMRNRFGSSDGFARLVLACFEGETRAYVTWGAKFIGSDGTSLEYRIDKQPAKKARVSISTDHTTTGYWGSGAIPFIKSLFGKQQLLARVTPYSDSPVMVTFPIAGLDDAIKPLRKACSW